VDEGLLRLEQLPDGSGLRLVGEVDMSNAEALEEALALAFQKNGGSVVIDCSELTYMDSSGFRALLRSAELLPDGHKLVIASPARLVLWSMKALGLHKLPRLEIRGDGLEEAFQPGFGPGAANRFELACLAYERTRRNTSATLAHSVAALSCNRRLRAERHRLLTSRAS